MLEQMAGDRPPLRRRQLAILEAIRACGSLNAAAHHLGISYRNAWVTLRQLERMLGVALTAAQTGGKRGGGSRLTAAGEDFVRRLNGFLAEQRTAARQAAHRHFRGAPAATHQRGTLRLATTTSMVDSGLLAALLPPFSARTGVVVDVAAVGSGAALRLARDGQVDAVLAHAPALEERAEAGGHVVHRSAVMSNHFVIVGPADDPAHAQAAATPTAALRRIAAAGAPFLSRGDRSGTHACEQALLCAGGVRRGAWYRLGRCGMAELLRRASTEQAYTLSDSSTFTALAERLALEVVADGARHLHNRYSIAATNPHRHRAVRFVEALALIGWLTSPDAQELIVELRIGGRRLAEPAAGR
jgi:tungstate transport system substrate-binding protein